MVREILHAPKWQLKRDSRVSVLAGKCKLQGKRLLDVGCSKGDFLLAAKALGASPVGLDMDEEATRFVQRELGIPAICADLGNVELGQGEFDLITCWDLIEHLVAPHGGIRKLSAALRGGGRIVLWTPNGDLIRRWGQDWVGFRVDLEHLQYFDATTITWLLKAHGITVLHLEAMGFPTLGGLVSLDQAYLQRRAVWRERIRRHPALFEAVQALRRMKKRLLPTGRERVALKYKGYHLLAIGEKAV